MTNLIMERKQELTSENPPKRGEFSRNTPRENRAPEHGVCVGSAPSPNDCLVLLSNLLHLVIDRDVNPWLRQVFESLDVTG